MGSHDLKGPAAADWLSPTLMQLQLLVGPTVDGRRYRGNIVRRRFEDEGRRLSAAGSARYREEVVTISGSPSPSMSISAIAAAELRN